MMGSARKMSVSGVMSISAATEAFSLRPGFWWPRVMLRGVIRKTPSLGLRRYDGGVVL
jgi:hypothetical protein